MRDLQDRKSAWKTLGAGRTYQLLEMKASSRNQKLTLDWKGRGRKLQASAGWERGPRRSWGQAAVVNPECEHTAWQEL